MTSPQGLTRSNYSCLWRILQYAKPYRRQVIVGAIAAVTASVLQLLQVTSLKHIIDQAVAGTAVSDLLLPVTLLVSLVCGSLIADAVHMHRMSVMSQRITTDIQNDMHLHIHTLGERFFMTHPPGDLVERLFRDTASAQQLVMLLLGTLIRHPLTLILVGGYLTIQAPMIAAIALSSYAVVAALVRATTSTLQPLARDVAANRSGTSERVLALLQARSLLPHYDPDLAQRGRVLADNERFLQLGTRLIRLRCIITPMSQLVTFLVFAALVLLIANQVQLRMMDAGTATSMFAALVVFRRPLNSMSQVAGEFRHALASAHRVLDVLEQPTYWTRSGVHPSGPPRRIELRAVTVTIPERRFSLPPIDLTLRSGEIVALVGVSGVGKSTIQKLLTGSILPSTGQILCDGVPLEELDLRALSRHIALVPQRCPVLGETLREELLAGTGGTEADLRRVARLADLEDWLASLPDGWETAIGPRGRALSGGERQRLAIARSLIERRGIYLFDEATSELDHASEQRVLEHVAAHVREANAIAILISHRTASLADADRFLLLEPDGLREFATLAELQAFTPVGPTLRVSP